MYLIQDPLREDWALELKIEEEKESKWQVVEACHIRRSSRFHWAKEGDLPMIFFFSYLRGRSKLGCIAYLMNSKGEKLEEEEDMLEEAFAFFTDLLSKRREGRSNVDYLKENIDSRLSMEEGVRLDEEVRIVEVEHVVKKLARKKSLGLNMIPNEFYHDCWE